MIVISHRDVAPRFDLAMEVAIAEIENGALTREPRMLVLSEPSGDELCGLADRESVDLVICGGIDQVHQDYLGWKKIGVIEGIIGPYSEALDSYIEGGLESNAILPGADAKK